MGLKLYYRGIEQEFKYSKFPGGESHIAIPDNNSGSDAHVKISMAFESNSDIIDLALMVDAVRRTFYTNYIALEMTYLPYARQDRQCNPGESLSLKVVCDIINSLKFNHVYCSDIHSDVGVALLDNLFHTKQASCAWRLPFKCNPDETVLVSPDAGALKKVFDVAKALGYNNVVCANKKRNVATGKIEGVSVSLHGIGSAENFLIVDDILDGGASFVHLAKAIVESPYYEGEPLFLYVTHGIFSAGLETLEKYFTKIYVHNLMNKQYNNHPLIEII